VKTKVSATHIKDTICGPPCFTSGDVLFKTNGIWCVHTWCVHTCVPTPPAWRIFQYCCLVISKTMHFRCCTVLDKTGGV